MTTYLISDLHLCEEATDSAALFFRFMQEKASKAQALYVLGDLFEAWVGDDDDDPFNAKVMASFRHFADRGGKLAFVHGNRDFLLGAGFAERCGGKLLSDETVVELAGQRTLLLHGDQLCSDDKEYQHFRAMVRSPAWRDAFLDKPLAERKAIAADLRRKSHDSQQNKSEYITDVNQQTLELHMAQHDVWHCIHGHTHRPAVHGFTLLGKAAERIVLGDWHHSAKIVKCDVEIELITLV